MNQINLVQLGVGLIGRTVIEQVRQNREFWQEQFGFDVVYRSLIDTSTAVCCQDDHGYSDSSLEHMLQVRSAGGSIRDAAEQLSYMQRSASDAVALVAAKGPTIVLDTATGSGTAAVDAHALGLATGVVLSNKAPLALDWDDSLSQQLWRSTGLNGKLRYETTCGAGLPVISTLQALLDTGDEPGEITGSLSGTFGVIFSALGEGATFSTAITSAREQGFTEPDPRDDLSGLDVARKALILARTMGRTDNLEDVAIESLVPAELVDVSVGEFMSGVSELDERFASRSESAHASGSSLKYVASVPRNGQITVGVREIPVDTVLGSLQGPENIVTFRTSRYDSHPLTIVGPGAGAAVTAAGVVADMLVLATAMMQERE